MLKTILLLAVALSIPCFASHQCPDGKTNSAWCAQPQPVPPQFPTPAPKPPSVEVGQPISEDSAFVGAPKIIPVRFLAHGRPFGSSILDGALGNPLNINKTEPDGGVDYDCYWNCIIAFGPGLTIPALLYCKEGCKL